MHKTYKYKLFSKKFTSAIAITKKCGIISNPRMKGNSGGMRVYY